MYLCFGCHNTCDLLDNIETKVLQYHCKKCNVNTPITDKVIFKRNFNKVYTAPFNKMMLCDPSLPRNLARNCDKCHGNNIVYTRNANLTLNHYCVVCEKSIN